MLGFRQRKRRKRVAQNKSSEDSMEAIDGDFPVELAAQITAAFEPWRSSHNASMKDKPSFKSLAPSKVTKSRGKPTSRKLSFL